MTELLDVGKHCALESCKKLDYTPFHCKFCSKDYCTEHRFLHGCNASKIFDPSAPSSSAALRPYLCSKEGCFTGESIKIVCPFCSLNFCLKHRHASEHSCQHVTEEAEKDPEIVERLRKMKEMLGPLVEKEKQEKEEAKAEERSEIQYTEAERIRMNKINAMKSKLAGKVDEIEQFSSNKGASESKNQEELQINLKSPSVSLPPLTPQQQKEDKIAVMKLKMTDKPKPGDERQILFIEWFGGRKPIFINKTWTLGKAISTAKEKLNLNFEVKSFSKRGLDQKLDVSDNVRDVLKEEDTIVLN